MTKRQILEELKRDELIAAVERFELEVADKRVRSLLIEALASSRKARIATILGDLKRDRLKELCRAFGLDDGGREKALIVERLTGKGPAAREKAVKRTPVQTTLDLWDRGAPQRGPRTDAPAQALEEPEARRRTQQAPARRPGRPAKAAARGTPAANATSLEQQTGSPISSGASPTTCCAISTCAASTAT